MRPDERTIAEGVQEWGAEAGLAPSLNDVFCHLIRRAQLPIPRTAAEGMEAIRAHWADCADCESHRPPRCLDGLYLRDLNKRISSAPGLVSA
jgi:hypothetical protein